MKQLMIFALIFIFVPLLVHGCTATNNAPGVIAARQTEFMPEVDKYYVLEPNDMFKCTDPGPAEMSTSKAWSIANEFVYRTALRHSCQLPAAAAGPEGEGFVMRFKAVGGTGEVQVYVAQDFDRVKRQAEQTHERPAPRAGGPPVRGWGD